MLGEALPKGAQSSDQVADSRVNRLPETGQGKSQQLLQVNNQDSDAYHGLGSAL